MSDDDDRPPIVLLVEDDTLVRRGLEREFLSLGFAVREASNYEEALYAARSCAVELAVIDLHLPSRSGLEVLAALQSGNLCQRAVLLTGFGSIPTAVESIRLGAVNYLTKPTNAAEILRALDPVGGQPTGEESPLPSLARTEWEHINRALAESGWNVSEAARRLRIPRRTLQRKLRKSPPEA
jgi:two-component system response regulator RegA